MKPSDPDSLHLDAQAVAAVRQGDRERFRELLDRHASKVFAVAWCRLGDRDLAEEAAQEAFINAYRRLPLLVQAEKFGSWITTIARNTAINLGLRHRNELQKRKRWALERSADGSEAPASEEDSRLTAETVRESIAKLPAIHRECLVLYYLQGHSVAESAALLSLSETAFKVRLHRARGALREQLETYLEQSLDQLRPSSQFTAAVMLALPALKPITPIVGTLFSGAAPAVVSKVGLFFIQIFTVIPALLLSWWLGRKDIANLRDQEGFRAINHRRFLRRALIFFSAMMGVIFLINHFLEPLAYMRLTAVFAVIMTALYTRPLFLVRTRVMIGNLCSMLVVTIGCLGIAFLHWPISAIGVFQGLLFLIMSFVVSDLPVRVDTSLFLRAANGLITTPDATTETNGNVRLRFEDLFRFGQFLGNLMLVIDWRSSSTALQLRLSPVTPSHGIPTIWGDASYVVLECQGQVSTHIGARDVKALSGLTKAPDVRAEELEDLVAKAVSAALADFMRGDFNSVTAILGETAPEKVYRTAPETAFPAVFKRSFLRVTAVLMFALAFWTESSFRAARRAVPGLDTNALLERSRGELLRR